MNLKGRDFLKLLDFSPAEVEYLLDLSAELKLKKKNGIPHKMCEGKNIALIFEKTSTRTRCSFEVAAYDLGMGVTYLEPSGSQIGKKESIADTARVLSRIYDGIEYRGFGQEIVEELAKYSSVPVWNGLTNEFHPTQILADFLTIKEHFGRLKGINFVYMGDARYNMGNSLMVGCAKMGMHFVACAPKKYFPDAKLVAECEAIAKETGATLSFNEDVISATKGADVIYTDEAQPIGYITTESAHIGYKARLWKIVKENGVEVERTQINSSSYKATPRYATVGVATSDPNARNEIMAAIGTSSIDHVRNVIAILTAPPAQ